MKQLSLLRNAFFSTDTHKRHDARYRLAKTLTHRLGFQILNPNVNWFAELKPLAARWQEIAQTRDYLSERHYVVYSMAKAVANLPGETAECGVYFGASSFMICSAKPDGAHHVFDSFEGLSAPEAIDIPADDRAYTWQAHDLAVSLDTVTHNLRSFPAVHCYQGWIPARFAEVAEHRFSFVHIDVDLYQPTRDSLAFFYDRTIPGGIILCDDFGSINCPGATRAFDEFLADKPEKHVIQLTTGQGFIIKR
jgi:O-methyltransferase